MVSAIFEQIVNGIVSGSVYAIVAVGMTMIFGVLRAINFAHGEYYMLGTFGAWFAIEYFDLPYPVAIVIGVIATAVIAVVVIAVVGRVVLKPLFRLAAGTDNPEFFMAATLLISVGSGVIAAYAGLSMALGAFIAGLLLAETQYRRAVEAMIDPFRGLLLGVFFFSVGMHVDLGFIWREPLLVAGAFLAVILVKTVLLAPLCRLFGVPWAASVETALLLAPGGEFAFIGIGLAVQVGLVAADVAAGVLAVVSLTMTVLPLIALFARRAGQLRKLGVNVEILDVKAMTKLGMGALLGVAQGSTQPGRTVIMRWNGGKRGDQPVAFIGKGVCFDTGGISIKGAASMEDMKGDMGGAACVVGLMHALAARKAKVNVVGAIGVVENMPDGNAQRPGDIVTSMSGQTIEIINTDAEGRLVLADVLWYVAKKFKPKFMVDLATLTGAIMVALGTEYAGLFSNNDELAERLTKVGLETGERVWRMPLGPEYDKQIDSQFADMKNTGNRNGGSITAAQFLQRFVDDTPWAHLDIAGTAMGAPKSEINHSWGSGFGVRLLERLVADYYEAKK